MGMMDRGAREANLESAARDGYGRVAALSARNAELESALRHAVKIEDALRDVVRHWREFGPSQGLDEKIEVAAKLARI